MASIRIDGLTKVYPGDVTAIDGLDLTVADGSFFALLGPSGCGKTTLLRTIAGLEDATGGAIHIGDRDVTKLSPGDRNVAMVFQDYALFPHMSVTDNIAYPLRIRKVGRSERAPRPPRPAPGLGLAALWSAGPASSPAASSSGWRWRARWPASRTSSSSTSRCRTSTPASGSRRAPSSSGCSATST